MKHNTMNTMKHIVACLLIIFSHVSVKLGAQPTTSNGHGMKTDEYQEAIPDAPMAFCKNVGQVDAEILYYAKDLQAHYSFKRNGIVSTISRADDSGKYTYGFNFKGMSPFVRIHPKEPSHDRERGNLTIIEGNHTFRNVPHFKHVLYEDVWKGVQVDFYNSHDGLKYDFIVAPGTSPSVIQLEMEGVQSVRVNPNGELAFMTPLGEFRQGAPYTYQMIQGEEVPVECKYTVDGFVVRFETSNYDKRYPLVIDPVALKWATKLGGLASFETYDSHLDEENGLLYLAGTEEGTVLATDAGFFSTPDNSNSHAFIMCMKADGSEVLWKTQFRSVLNEGIRVKQIDVNEAGEVFAVIRPFSIGRTDSETTNVFGSPEPEIEGVQMTNDYNRPAWFYSQSSHFGIEALVKLNNDGTKLLYFTYLQDLPQDGHFAPIRYDFTEKAPFVLDNDGNVIIAVKYKTSGFEGGGSHIMHHLLARMRFHLFLITYFKLNSQRQMFLQVCTKSIQTCQEKRGF